MNWILAALLALLLMLIAVTATWSAQKKSGDASVIDGVWVLLISLAALFYAVVGEGSIVVRGAVAIFALIWGLRLGLYLLLRSRSQGEDRRYAELRSRWGAETDRRMLLFFLVQAVTGWAISLTFVALCWQDGSPNPMLLMLAIMVFMVAIAGSTIADLQLAAFRQEPGNSNRVCRNGLWQFSRHPNYFFESLHWWCYPLLAVSAVNFAAALIGPVLVTLLLLKISGIPTVESGIDERRPGYASYRAATNAFLPAPPRKSG